MFLLRRRPTSTDPGTVADLSIQEQKENLLRNLILREPESAAFDKRHEKIRRILLLSWTKALTQGGAVGCMAWITGNFCQKQFGLSKSQVVFFRAAWGLGISAYISRSYFVAKYEAMERLAQLQKDKTSS
jgi:hypothetical protein